MVQTTIYYDLGAPQASASRMSSLAVFSKPQRGLETIVATKVGTTVETAVEAVVEAMVERWVVTMVETNVW